MGLVIVGTKIPVSYYMVNVRGKYRGNQNHAKFLILFRKKTEIVNKSNFIRKLYLRTCENLMAILKDREK